MSHCDLENLDPENLDPESTRRIAPVLAAAERLRHDRPFRRYWSAHAISAAGSTVSLVVLPILMFQRTESALLTALLGTVYIAPYVLLGLFAWALPDRIDRRRLMISCEFGSAITLGSIPIASALGVLSTAHLFVTTTMAGILFVGFESARFGALPALFGRDRLIMVMTALGLALVHNFVLALAVYLAFNVTEMLAIRSAIAFRQLNTPDQLQGRST